MKGENLSRGRAKVGFLDRNRHTRIPIRISPPEKKLGKNGPRVYAWPSIIKRETGPLLWPETA